MFDPLEDVSQIGTWAFFTFLHSLFFVPQTWQFQLFYLLIHWFFSYSNLCWLPSNEFSIQAIVLFSFRISFWHVLIFSLYSYFHFLYTSLLTFSMSSFSYLNMLKTLFFPPIFCLLCLLSALSHQFLLIFFPWNRDFFPPVPLHILYFFSKNFIIESSNGISLEIRLFQFSRDFLLLLLNLLIFLLFYDLFPRDLPGV